VDFYSDVLGTEVFREYGGTCWVIKFQGCRLLSVTGGGSTEDKPDVMFASLSDPNTVSHQFAIRVPDCRAAYEVLKARGAEFLTPPYG